MQEKHEEWRFMRRRAEQLFEEGDVKRSLRMMRLINRRQQEAFDEKRKQKRTNCKIVSTR